MATTVRANRGFHPLLEAEQPHIFIDTCVQIWPDADLTTAHQHGVTVYGVTSWLPHADVARALEDIMYWHLMVRRHPNLVLATSADTIRNAKAEGKAALLITSQDGDFIGNKLHRIEAFYRLGLRIMLPAYNRTNLICDGCLDRTNSGLTSFGELVVDECNRVGLLLDCTHIGRQASLDIIERSSQPCIFSHSNPRAITDSPRNIDDEQIRACAARGGVIGIVPWGPLVLKPGSQTRPTIDDFIANIDYVAQLLGNTDHIGIGTDFSLGTYPEHWHDPWGEPPGLAVVTKPYNAIVTGQPTSPLHFPEGFDSYTEIVDVSDKLRARGYQEEDIAKILGENFLRVFAEVWR